MSSCVDIDNRGKDILIIGKGSTQGLNNTLTEKTRYSTNFTRLGMKFCLSLHYNGSNSLLFVHATKIYQLKANDSEIKKMSFVFRKYFRSFSSNNIKKTGLNGNLYDFSVDLNVIDISNIIDIHKY